MNRSLRHPRRGRRHYLRLQRDRQRGAARRRPRQPKIGRSRLSQAGLFDAPSSAGSRPVLRLRIAGVIVVGLFAVLGLRLWTLQVIQAPQYLKAVAANRIRAVPIAPIRGLILDRNGVPLVTNSMNLQITLSRGAAQLHRGVIGRLAALLGETSKQVRLALANSQYSPYQPVPVLSNAPMSDVLYINEHQSGFPGVTTVQATERVYPQVEAPSYPGGTSAGYPASHALGYVGTITAPELAAHPDQGYHDGSQVGQTGLEAQYQKYLRGVSGQRQYEVAALGQVVGTLKSKPAKPGDSLITNLSLGLQQEVDTALAQQITSLRGTVDPNTGRRIAATNGAAVVLDPQTGAVLAMSSYPSYNPSIWIGGISQANYSALTAARALNNFAIDGQYTPGSTFKLDTATAALSSGLWSANETYTDTGIFTIPNCVGKCRFHGAGYEKLGTIDISTALTASDDVFFYNLGYQFYSQAAKYGPTPIQDAAARYGLGRPTGIDLPGEARGQVDSPALRQQLHKLSPTGYPNAGWYVGDNLQLAFGQGLTQLTPIQQAVAYATFANGGIRYAPEIAAAVVSPSGKLVKRFAPKVTGRVSLPPSVRDPMLAGFEGVISRRLGTAYQAFRGFPLATFPLAGKTGTASRTGKEPNSWFVAWGPVPDPNYVVAVVIDQAGYGATGAAPVVRTIYNYLLQHPVGPVRVPPPASVAQSTTTVPPAGGSPATPISTAPTSG
ncbi:MAG: penicillin-binding protein 2 [Acidimicrobiales bacterium]